MKHNTHKKIYNKKSKKLKAKNASRLSLYNRKKYFRKTKNKKIVQFGGEISLKDYMLLSHYSNQKNYFWN